MTDRYWHICRRWRTTLTAARLPVHELAILVYNVLKYGTDYVGKGDFEFTQENGLSSFLQKQESRRGETATGWPRRARP